jgi:hypothetical protein
MEIVWYRMLSPILGGSVFTFGLILCAVLLGIGLGGLLYAFSNAKRAATLWGFAFTCLLEAGFVMLAYALGDDLAWAAAALQSFTVFGFGGLVFSWALIIAITVVPAGIVAGYQFPMLIALLGKGRADVGRHVGAAYAWNTAGAIAGSLAGGFVLLPILTAPGCWRMVGILLVILGVWTCVMQLRQKGRWIAALARWGWPALCSSSRSFLMAPRPPGVTAALASAGSNSATSPHPTNIANGSIQRCWTIREMEGVESCIGITARGGLARRQRKGGWQLMGRRSHAGDAGVPPALLHHNPRSAAVVGPAPAAHGRLGAMAASSRVDVVEL